MLGSAEVNKAIRAILIPALREHGFTKLRTRHNWRYFSDCVWALHLHAVGAYFSSVTGFPPMSLAAELCIYYLDFPAGAAAPLDTDGLPIPAATHGHVRLPLAIQSNQDEVRPASMRQIERRRDDIWWLSPDGSNLIDAITDIRNSVIHFGIPYLEKPFNSREEQIRRRALVDKHDA